MFKLDSINLMHPYVEWMEWSSRYFRAASPTRITPFSPSPSPSLPPTSSPFLGQAWVSFIKGERSLYPFTKWNSVRLRISPRVVVLCQAPPPPSPHAGPAQEPRILDKLLKPPGSLCVWGRKNYQKLLMEVNGIMRRVMNDKRNKKDIYIQQWHNP